MPIASIMSARTGQAFDVEFSAPPTEEDIDEATSAWETQFYQREGLDPSIAEQGVLGTAGNAFARDLGGVALDTVGGVAKGAAETKRALGPAGEALRLMPGMSTVMSLGGAGDAVAGFTDAVRERGREVYPTNPANPVAETIGGGAGQAVAMLGTMGAAAPVMGTGAALTVVPSVLGGTMGLGSGIDTAKDMGIDNPAGRLALGAAFGGAEAITERLGGIGGKAAAKALQQGVRAGLKQAGKSVLSEAIEEPISGTLQDAATFTAGQFVADPNRPGYTTNGTKLPALDAEFLKRRKLEAIGGAAGGVVFGGLQMVGTQAGRGEEGKRGAGEPGPPPLPVREDLGELTAEDVADLEEATVQDSSTVPARAPILTNVPDRVDATFQSGPGITDAEPGSSASSVPAPAADALGQPVSEVASEPAPLAEVSQPVPLELMTSAQAAELGVNMDVQAARQRYESARAANDPREGMLAEAAITAAQAGTGRNAQRVQNGRMAAVDQAVAEKRPVNAAALEQWAQVPVEGAGFDASGNIPRRGIPAGYQKDGDVYTAALGATSPDARVPAAAETSGQAGVQPAGEAVQASAMQVLRAANDTLPEQGRAVWTPEVYAAAEEYYQTGEKAPLLKLTPIQRRRVIQAGLEADPVARAEQERADRKGEHKIRSQEKRDAAFEQKTTFKNLKTSGSTAGFVNTEVLAEAQALLVEGVRDFANWSRAMVTRFGQAIRDFLQGIWEQVSAALPNDAAKNVRLGSSAKAAPVGLAQGGFVMGPNRVEETKARFARPEERERLYQVREDVTVKAAAEAWVDSMPMEQAVAAMEAGRLPADMTGDVAQHAAGLLIQRTTEMMKSNQEVVQMQARSLGHRISKVWQGWLSQEAGRNLRQRSVVSAELTPYAPILAAEGMLIDRADAVMDKRFNGGAEGVKTKIQKILADADLDISERVERILATVMQSALKPVTSIKDAVAALLPGKSQREQMIEDVAQALMIKARGNVVTPERKTALAALAASLKQTLGASVQGDAKKAAASPLGEVLARAFVDQVSEAKLFREAWEAGRQSVFDMFYDMELDKDFHPARMRAEQARARLMQLEGGNAAQQAASAAERADLKQTLEDLKAKMQTAKAKADGMTDAFWKQVGALMPATPTMAYAPGMSKEAIKRGFEAAGYTAEIKTGMNKDGTRTLNVQDALRDPQRAMTAVLNVWDSEAMAAGIDPAAWQEGRKIAWAALQETMTEWQQKADERAAKLAQAQKDALLAKDSPALVRLLKDMAGKIAPGMDWTEIFTDLQGTQKERQRAIYARLMQNERLQGLTKEERLALTNQLDKAWQQERRKVFNRELTKAGILGEKSDSDRLKVKNAMPKLLRLINLGMFNSEMFREAVAPEYGLKQITTGQALALRKLAEEAYALPEGVLRSRKLAALLDGIQKSTGTGLPEVLNQYWVAAVLSGMRTQFDTFMSLTNGFGNQLIQSGMLAIKNGNRAAAMVSMLEWWRGLKQAFPEAMQILSKGDYSYLKRFNDDLRKALEGETTFRPVPLGEALWRDGNAMEKYGFAPVMIWTGRLMAAADHLNNSATTAGAKVVARALHPELYKTVSASQSEREAAAAQARREVTGGAMPATAPERATVAARTREILNGQLRPEEVKEAAFMGDQAAYQNDPTGVFGGIYRAVNQGLGTLERGLQAYAEERGADGPAGRYARGMMLFFSGAMRSMMGAKFIRFGANFGNDMLGYVPGTVLVSPALLGTEATRSQRQLLMGKNVFGLMAGLTVAAMFLGKDDEEEGWHMEGPWSDLTPEEVKQRRAAGFESLTFWKRTADKVERVSYKQWPTAGLLAGVAHMQDRQRFRPEKWAKEGMAGHLLAAATVGAFQVKDVSAMRGLADLLGASKFGANPEDALVEKMAKMPVNFAGGFIPTLVKDLDALADSRRYKPETVMEEFLRNVPLARRAVAGGRPEINILGVAIEQDRKPWSRAYTDAESGPAHAVLGSLSARGFTLPTPETNRKVWKDGAWSTIAAMGADAEWRYQKKVGDGYRAWLGSSEGRALLTMPDGLAVQKLINRQADTIKRQALQAVMK